MSARLTIVALACLISASALALADEPHQVNVPAGNLIEGLESLAKQCGVDIIYPSGELKGLKTRGVSGTLEPKEAFRRLIEGTPLILKERGNALLISLPGASTLSQSSNPLDTAGPDNQPQEGKSKSSGNFLLGQVDQGQTSSPSTVEKQDEQATKRKPIQLEEVIVTGTRIPTAAGQLTLPVLSYTREDIESSGQTTIGEFLSTLPDVSTSTSSYQVGFPGAQTVQLHGLPVGATLTLLDGQRVENSLYGYFDLSNIPMAAVERIEILPVGTSAVYGADGLGGAVNTILRKNFDGFEADATLDHAGGVDNPSVSLALGKSWDQGSVSLMGSYQERGALLGIQREPWSLTSFPPNLPASTLSAIASTSCAPGNVYSTDGSNLPGLSAPEAAIPAGITGRPTIGQFAATAGKQNLCNTYEYEDVTPHSERASALLSAHYDLTRSADLFTAVLFSHGDLRNQVGPQIGVSQYFGGTLAANNPYNPFGEAVNVSLAYPGGGTFQDESTSFVRPLIGVRGALSFDWHYEVTAYFSRDQFNTKELSADQQGIANALASHNPATALNPFTSGAPGTRQLLNSLFNPPVDSTGVLNDNRIVSGQGILRGPVLPLPAGALQAVIGGEYRQEKEDTAYTGVPYAGIAPYLLHRDTYAAFAEARIPLLAGGAQRDERLALTLAGRYDHSNDYGGKATWQSGLLWHATDELSFRGGYGLSYQAPQLLEISGPQNVTAAPFGLGIPDPFRGNQLISYPLTFVSGPNFNLKPETGDSFTLGLEYSSQTLPALHASLTWYELSITDYIGAQALETLLSYPNLFPGAVIRAPPTAQDLQLGYLGLITRITDSYYNFGDLHVAGFDADIRYAIDIGAGQVTPSVAIANVYKWQSALLPGTSAIDGLSQATLSGVGWSPRWKGTAALAWKRGPISTSIAGRYISRYRDYQDYVPNTNEIGNTWIFDFNAHYEAGKVFASTNRVLAQSYIGFGAVNLFNRTPPFSYTPYMYDPEEYDIRGRYWHLDVGLRF